MFSVSFTVCLDNDLLLTVNIINTEWVFILVNCWNFLDAFSDLARFFSSWKRLVQRNSSIIIYFLAILTILQNITSPIWWGKMTVTDDFCFNVLDGFDDCYWTQSSPKNTKKSIRKPGTSLSIFWNLQDGAAQIFQAVETKIVELVTEILAENRLWDF